MMRFAVAAATTVLGVGVGGQAQAYTYIPTPEDRVEIRSCINSAGPNTMAIDCVMPTVNRIVSQMMSDVRGPEWPTPPTQVSNMIRSAGMICGMPDEPGSPVTPQAKPCLNTEVRKIVAAIVTALRDTIQSMIRP